MTIDFSSIHFDVQLLITKKLDFRSSVQLQLSSRIGRLVGNSTIQSTVLNVKKVQCDQDIVRLMFEDPLTQRKSNKRWVSIRQYSKLPRFCVEYVEKFKDVSFEALNTFLEEAMFSKKKAKLYWERQRLGEVEIFVKLVEKINVTSLYFGYSNDRTDLIYLPEFLKMESIDNPVNPLTDEIFLTLHAHSIQTVNLSSRPDIRFTVNRFFKQWISGNREIKSVWIKMDGSAQREHRLS